MDFSTPLAFVGIFIATCLILILITFFYKSEMREKTYEEALAEQRQQTQALLGIKQSKPKEKKKKAAKKAAKEKQSVAMITETSSEVDNDSEDAKANSDVTSNQVLQNHLQHAGKLHVEFKEQPEEVVFNPKEHTKKKANNKKDKIQPILLKKDKSPETVNVPADTDTPTRNHFEEIHPLDEFELLNAHSKLEPKAQEKLSVAPVSEKKVQELSEQQTARNKKKSEKQSEMATSSPASVSQPTTSGTTVIEKHKDEKTSGGGMHSSHQLQAGSNSGKEKKKKKNENLQQILTAAEGEGLINLVRNAELSRSEVQKLIDLLLNKQQDNPTFIDDDWTEGKSDPVPKLKKQLAEKEKLLEIEQQALAGAKIKLQEVRAEQQVEKLQLQQKIRYLEEGLQAKHKEVQSINANLQNLTQKVQMQAQNEEILRRLQEENHQLQYRLSQMQEAENVNAKLRNDLHEKNSHIQQLTMELAQVTNDAFAEKEHKQQLFLQLNNVKQELDQSIEFKRQFEEMKMDYEKKLEKAYRDENEWQREISKITAQYKQQTEELRRIEHETQQLKQEIKQLTINCSDGGKLVAQLKAELQKVQEEKAAMNGAAIDESKQKEYEVQVLNLNNKLSSLQSELQQIKMKSKNDLETTTKKCQELESELKEQKIKNDDLRAKNWKVVEALNAAESRSVSANKSQIDINKLSTEIRNEQQTNQRLFLERLFPNIEFKNKNSDDWESHYEELIKNHINSLKKKAQEANNAKEVTVSSNGSNDSEEIIRLRAQVTHYQKTVDEHVEYLADLEEKIEQGERKMQQRLAEKDEELIELKERLQSEKKIEIVQSIQSPIAGMEFAYNCMEKSLPVIIDELERKIEDLEEQLSKERNEKKHRLHHDLDELKSNNTETSTILTTKKLLTEEAENIRNFQNGELASAKRN